MGARRRRRAPYSVRVGAVGCLLVVLIGLAIAIDASKLLPPTLIVSAVVIGLWAIAEYRRTKPKD